jgi:nucleoside-triphosphatase
MPKKNLFLTGPPSIGKTTVIKKIVETLRVPVTGFYTQEEREGDRRVGFVLHTLDGRTAYLAHQEIESEFAVRRYGVSIRNIEEIAVPSIAPRAGTVIILDEIGKMECFSAAFRQAARAALESANIVIGTVTLGGGEFIQAIKSRADMEITEVTLANRNELPAYIAARARGLPGFPE